MAERISESNPFRVRYDRSSIMKFLDRISQLGILMLELLQGCQILVKVTRWFWHDRVLRKKKKKEGDQSVMDEQFEYKKMGKLME